MSDYPKVLSVIRSCKTVEQNAVAAKMITRYAIEEWRKTRHINRDYCAIRLLFPVPSKADELLEENERMLEVIRQNKGAI